ncbi:hypothetical protein, partial [Haemophilus paraphrohaemolyticus]|uniref:hypothetical protein n=1 Tax=Haemophilus paraphrohaemolyticus TaxID=736 RepID=UPI00058732F5
RCPGFGVQITLKVRSFTINFIYFSIKITFQILSHWDECRLASIGAHRGGKQGQCVAEKLSFILKEM